MTSTDYLVWGVLLHLICDWPLQNQRIALNKTDLRHGAAWVHGFIHFVGMMLVFPFIPALIIAGMHMLIDTRKPFNVWVDFYGQTKTGEYAIPVAIWVDQVFHLAIIGIVASKL